MNQFTTNSTFQVSENLCPTLYYDILILWWTQEWNRILNYASSSTLNDEIMIYLINSFYLLSTYVPSSPSLRFSSEFELSESEHPINFGIFSIRSCRGFGQHGQQQQQKHHIIHRKRQNKSHSTTTEHGILRNWYFATLNSNLSQSLCKYLRKQKG